MLDKIISLSKRRGFIFQSSEIYGGLNGCWDYGPLGVELLRNIKEEWWKSMTYRSNIEGLDSSILMHPRVWEASGHVDNFTDPMIDCKSCKSRFRIDILVEDFSKKKRKNVAEGIQLYLKNNSGANSREFDPELIETYEKFLLNEKVFTFLVTNEYLTCLRCGEKQTLTLPRKFNLMFKTFVGPVEEEASVVFLRPETAQGIFVNFMNVKETSRQKIPFGIAQVGKAFRNEINTKHFLFRTREFEQMEMQYFIKPEDDEDTFVFWKEERLQWYYKFGIAKEKLRFNEHAPDKLAHYAKVAVDIEYEFPFGWGEIEGIHNRTDYDLKQHSTFSGKKLEYFDQANNEHFIPFIIETSAGSSRDFMAFLIDSYKEDEAPNAEGKMEKRTVLKLHTKLAPIKAAVFPLVNRDGMPERARSIYEELRTDIRIYYDDSGAIGRRYRRQDECGTPFCITVDTQTAEDATVTVRERDSMQQQRVTMTKLKEELLKRIN